MAGPSSTPGATPAAPLAAVHGRGAASNPRGRFERLEVEADPEAPPEEAVRPETVFYKDASRSIVSDNDSPDVGFESSVNPYRGCEHGCSYCYARPFHEFLGLSPGLDFETKIFVKEDAPALLRKELASPRWRPRTLALSGVTDPYQPIERRLRLTRGCLEVLAECRHPVAIITKNHLVSRDADLLGELARHGAASVAMSVTSLDVDLSRRLEPRASSPKRRLQAIEVLARAGVPVRVLVAPTIPGLSDHEIPAILAAAAAAGATSASYIVLRLPRAVEGLFQEWLEIHEPGRKEKVLSRLRSLRGGRLNDPRFGKRMKGEGPYADEIRSLFELACRRHGLGRALFELSTAAFRRPAARASGQLDLFGSV